jgi:hypothetical protein
VAGEGFVGVNFGGPFQWPDDTGAVEALRVEGFDDVRAGGGVWAVPACCVSPVGTC